MLLLLIICFLFLEDIAKFLFQFTVISYCQLHKSLLFTLFPSLLFLFSLSISLSLSHSLSPSALILFHGSVANFAGFSCQMSTKFVDLYEKFINALKEQALAAATPTSHSHLSPPPCPSPPRPYSSHRNSQNQRQPSSAQKCRDRFRFN